jgi:hypothetical protein
MWEETPVVTKRPRIIIDPAQMYCNTVWVPHPSDAFVFVARVGEHDANLLGRINNYVIGTRQSASELCRFKRLLEGCCGISAFQERGCLHTASLH